MCAPHLANQKQPCQDSWATLASQRDSVGGGAEPERAAAEQPPVLRGGAMDSEAVPCRAAVGAGLQACQYGAGGQVELPGHRHPVAASCSRCVSARDHRHVQRLCSTWGTVVKVADGVNDRVSGRKNAAVQKAGAVYIKWPADPDYDEKESFSWLVLQENKWNKNVHYGWR